MLHYYILYGNFKLLYIGKCYDIVIDIKKRYATIIDLGNTTLLL